MKGIAGLTLGRYELRRRIAQGGMAEVYLAYDRRVRRQVAVKVLYGRDEPFVRRFEREALAVGALSHNHILPLYDFGEQSPWYYLVMPYVDGCTLRDYIFQHKVLTLEEAASFLSQIASALQYAHDHGVVHRDVKPSNILLRQDGYAYLVDFGLAKAMQGAEALTSAGAMVGTPEYMAPEQSNGSSDYRSDIYSLGIILYQMLTGQLPFIAESPVAVSLKHIQSIPIPPRTLNKALPQIIEDVILKAMAKNPAERYQATKDLAAAFWKALQQEMFKEKNIEEHTLPTQTVQEEIKTSDVDLTETENQGDQEKQKVAAVISQLETPKTEAERIQLQLRPPIMPLRFPLTDKATALANVPDTTSLPPSMAFTRNIRHWSWRTIAALLALVVLLLALPLGMFTWQTQHLYNARNTSSTSTRSSSATLIGEATLAAQARVEGTAGITSAIGAGKVLYANTLTSHSGGWIDDGYQCFFDSQGYHVQTALAHEFAWCYSNQQTFTNMVLSAQAKLMRGEVYGLTFRLNPAAQQFYVLEVNSLGEYRFVLATGNNPTNWITLIDWTHSNSIQPGYQQMNTFLIIASDATFRFYLNKELIVTSYTNTVYTSGLVGFLVGGDTPGGTEAVFSNMLIFQK